MGLDVDAFSGLNWAKKWKERTSLNLFNARPYSDWFESRTLRLYLRSLEIEQMRADYSALSMYRFESPSNTGVIYWSFNKGGPLFQFGCVDYGGYPIMPYYAVKKVFAPIAVQARRDVSDISIMLSNHGAEAAKVSVEVFHQRKDGICLGYWQRKLRAESGELIEAFRLEDLYNEVYSRTEELIYVAASCNGELLADDMLFFCPFSEFEGEYRDLKVEIEKAETGRWKIRLGAKTPIRLVELESNHKLLFSDDYFPMIPEKGKIIEASLLEKTGNKQPHLTVGILGSENKQTFNLN
jgi:beta-mannosidase